jgi:hypothetical protein
VTPIAGGLFILPTAALPALGTVFPLRDITVWTAVHVFGAAPPLLYIGTSGDTVFHWTQTFLVLVAAMVVTAAWMGVDRRREHAALSRWFRLFIRFALAAQMFYYGLAKVIPAQFPPPSLVTLVQPVGQLEPSDLLSTFVGSSTAYQMFAGWAEVAAGVLLLAERTTALGALIALADMIQVFVLNMTYDFGLKQISFHLILFSLFLLAPDMRRLAGVLVTNRADRRASRRSFWLQIAGGVYLIAVFTNLSLRFWSGDGGPGSPRSALYGIWDVAVLAVDGVVQPPVLNDYDRRWRRVIFDREGLLVVQRTDDSFARYGASIDVERRVISLTKGNSTLWKASFTYDRPAADALVLQGAMDGHEIRADLRLVELDTFPLRSGGFRWVRPVGD